MPRRVSEAESLALCSLRSLMYNICSGGIVKLLHYQPQVPSFINHIILFDKQIYAGKEGVGPYMFQFTWGLHGVPKWRKDKL